MNTETKVTTGAIETTHDKYELPPLPEGMVLEGIWVFPEDELISYRDSCIRATIKADRKATTKQLAAYESLVASLEAKCTHMRKMYDELKARTNPDLLASERAANAILTAELEADRQRRGEPVAWPNGCDRTVPQALRYLAEYDRPSGGSDHFNSEHLFQLADEIEQMARQPLFDAPQPAEPARDSGRASYATITDEEALQAFHDCCRYEGIMPAEPVAEVPEGWREQFKEIVYDNLAAADNQDVPLEEYPDRILEVLDGVVGPRHPTVVLWRNDAIKTCTSIAYKYCRDPETYRYLKQDFEALITEAPQPAELVSPAVNMVSAESAVKLLNNLGYLYTDNGWVKPPEPAKVDAKASVPSDDALYDALSNLEHDNYEQSYSGYKNRQADITLIRAALARHG